MVATVTQDFAGAAHAILCQYNAITQQGNPTAKTKLDWLLELVAGSSVALNRDVGQALADVRQRTPEMTSSFQLYLVKKRLEDHVSKLAL